MKPINIIKKLNESTDWEGLKAGLSSCKSADDIEELMHETMDSSDYSKYCDYHYEIDDNDKSSISWAKSELRKLANSKTKKNNEFINKIKKEFKRLGGKNIMIDASDGPGCEMITTDLGNGLSLSIADTSGENDEDIALCYINHSGEVHQILDSYFITYSTMIDNIDDIFNFVKGIDTTNIDFSDRNWYLDSDLNHKVQSFWNKYNNK